MSGLDLRHRLAPDPIAVGVERSSGDPLVPVWPRIYQETRVWRVGTRISR